MTTTPTAPPPGDTGTLTDTDRGALALLSEAGARLRECLCTLARHGAALRLREPARAEALLAALGPWPVFKGGQFLFDLMEWEDFMVDGDPPPVVPPERIRAAAAPFAAALAAAAAHPSPGPAPGGPTAAALDLPLRLLAGTARAALRSTARDLADLFAAPPANGRGADAPDAARAAAPGGAGAEDAREAAPAPPPPGNGTGEEPSPGPAGPRAADGQSHRPPPGTPGQEPADPLPPLEAGFRLYEDVALGALSLLGPVLAAHAPAPGEH